MVRAVTKLTDQGTIFASDNFLCQLAREAILTQRRIDKERIERADREAKLLIEAETLARNAKTARLRALRLSSAQPTERPAPVKTRRPPAKKWSTKIIEVN